MSEPDFYLASSEGYGLELPRKAWRIRRLTAHKRDDFLLIRIDPAWPAKDSGVGELDIDMVLVATRHKGASLFPVNEWPVFVYVCRLLVDPRTVGDRMELHEFENIAWAELYNNEENARTKRF